jgi:tRNA pseudouridine32 synthase/23S rRNA pseudouridine746 synthase
MTFGSLFLCLVLVSPLLAVGHVVHVPVVFETPRLVIACKPAAVPFHNTGDQASLIDILRMQRAEEGVELPMFFPVHRLDTPTSGLVVFAKDREAAGLLQRGFQNRQRDEDDGVAVKKFYVALTGKKAKKMGKVEGGMAPARNGSWKLTKTKEEGGDRAVTRFADLGRAGEGAIGRLCILRPLTGRTHQLRVALKAIGAPILGDKRYGGRHADRLYLHAAGLRIDLVALGLGEGTVQLLTLRAVNQSRIVGTISPYFLCKK